MALENQFYMNISIVTMLLLGFDLQLIDYATKYSLAKTAKLIYIACVIYVLLNFNQYELEANWKLALEGEQIFKINPLQ